MSIICTALLIVGFTLGMCVSVFAPLLIKMASESRLGVALGVALWVFGELEKILCIAGLVMLSML